jgi:class 3 adenylate cyclase
MADLPTGTVTFLFTDIEGSAALWEQHREAARQVLVRHDALVEQIVDECYGHGVRPRGE